MRKKDLRWALNKVLNVADNMECKDLHHRKGHRHELGHVCLAEYELAKACSILREHAKDLGL